MSAQIGVQANGTQGVNQLNEALKGLHTTMNSLRESSTLVNNNFTNTLGSVGSPTQGIAQATAQYRQFSQELDQQRRLLGQVSTSYNDFANTMISSARSAGRAVQDYVAMRQELVNLGNAADVANRQISTLSFSSGMSYGQTMQYFSALSQQGGAFSPIGNQVGFDPGKQAQFMSQLTDAVVQATANGMHVSMPELLQGVAGLQNQMASRGIQASAGGNLGIMTAFSQSGGLGVFGAQGAGVIASINQSLAPGGQMNPLMQLYLQQQHPGQSYWQTQYQAEEGIRSPQDLYNLTQLETKRYGAAGQDKYFMAQALARDYGLSSAHVGMDVLNAQDYLKNINPNSDEYRMVSQYMQGGSLEYIGLANNIANNQYTKNGRFDVGAAAAEFKKESGRNIGGNLGGNATQGQFLTQLAQEGAPEGGTNAARSIEQSQANVANNYTEIAQKFSASIAALDGFNAGVSSAAKGLATLTTMLPGGGPSAGSAATIPVVGGLLTGVLQTAGMAGFGLVGAAHLAKAGKTAYTFIRGGGRAAAAGGRAAVAPATEAAVEGAPEAIAATAPEAITTVAPEVIAPTAAGGGLAALLGPAALSLAGIGLSGGLSQLASGSSASGGLPAAMARGLFNTVGAVPAGVFNLTRAAANNPLLRNTGFGQTVNNANNWAAQNVPGYDWLFGHTNPAATPLPGNTTKPGTTANPAGDLSSITSAIGSGNSTLSSIAGLLGNVLTESKASNETLNKILASVSTQTATNTDKTYQARYGITKTIANPNSPVTSTLNYGGSPGVVDGSGATSTSAAISGGGGTAGGTGFDSIVGGVPWTNGQGFGVVSNDVDQSIYNYGASYGLPKGHTGVDVDVPRGTKVYTPLAGVVMVAGGAEAGGGSFFVDDTSGAGTPATGELRIGVPNADGDILILGHLSKIICHIGDKVKAGQLVAYSGTANGDHVHVEYRKKTPGKNSGYTLVDPMQQINSMVPQSGGAGSAAAGPVSSGANGGGTSRWRKTIEQVSAKVGINPDVVQAIMMNEDPSGDPSSVSEAGAIGLMQVMPFNFLSGENTSDPYTQILAGARYLKGQYDKYGNWNSAAAGYLGSVDSNGNPGTAVDAYGTSGIKYAQRFQQHLAQLRASGTITDRPGSATASMQSIVASNAEKNLGLTADAGTGASANGSIEFAPLTVNVVYPDGTTVTSKLALTSKNPYSGIRQYTSRAVGRG